MSVLFVPLALAVVLSADGASVYRENCAACHGKEGHGDGPTAPELKYKPRDFREGKFAFGNTPGAMVKTVMSGIPGEETARMPAFKSVLAAEEIDAVVEYVRTMMPVAPAPTPTDMRLEPRDGALMVRGILPSFEKDGPPLARGLLIGLPSGFSFEYGTKPVRLLAVRRGEFVSRTDWEERGGRPLTPLGTVVLAAGAPEGWSPFVAREPPDAFGKAALVPLSARLRSTSVRDGAELAYDLVDGSGQVRAHVRERPREVAVSDGAGIMQELEVTAPAEISIAFSFTATSDPKLALPKQVGGLHGSKQTNPNNDPSAVAHAAEQKDLAGSTGWWVLRESETKTLALFFSAPENPHVTSWCGADRDVIDVWIGAGPKPATMKRIVVARGATTLESLQKMYVETKELR